MDIGMYSSYQRARGITKHKTAVPFYPRPPTVVPTIPAQAGGGKAKPAATPWPAPAPPQSAVAVEVVIGNGGAPAGGDDVDRRAAMFISRVQERLRRERMNEDWRKYY
ncbi:hypothetical protein PR202_gb15899 [Eleusine coracana subsp. coracana]|uniref:Uncharacterized protein n=1 Tax=Eleusine coracana subsp. coracana TaxID=191504 RepID=A0AAV5EZ41_ELECO|nr:hypothetical protein QOZ80_4BG0351790 [Eleusine coracana subsp. coracana]GJN27844.1 hypothetical protein PR202_gb15899 [Eleusine coracana subsp. coracana]